MADVVSTLLVVVDAFSGSQAEKASSGPLRNIYDLLNRLNNDLFWVGGLDLKQNSNDGFAKQEFREIQHLVKETLEVVQKRLLDMEMPFFRKVIRIVLGTSNPDDIFLKLDHLRHTLLQLQRFRESPARDFSSALKAVYNGILHTAVESGELDLVLHFLKAGAEVSYTNAEGRGPLHIAARSGHGDMAEYLLGGHDEVSIDMQDKQGKTPLYYAVECGHLASVKLLLEKGANPNRITNQGSTILGLVLGKESRQEIATQLLKHSASPSNIPDPGVLELITAAAQGHDDIIMDILSHGVDVNGQDGFGYNALYEAARFGNCETVKLLIGAGANPNSKTGLSGDTTLHGIIDKGRRCRELLHRFKDNAVFAARTVDTPPLCSNHLEVAEVLLQYGTLSHTKRWDDWSVGKLIREALADRTTGYSQALTIQEEEVIKKIDRLIENPPIVKRKTPLEKWSPVPQKIWGQKLVCQYFKIRAHQHNAVNFTPRLSTISKLIYDRENVEENQSRELQNWKNNKTDSQCWRWIHLPANNKRWAKDLISVLFRENDPENDQTMSKSRGLEEFMDESYHEFRGAASYTRYRKPGFETAKGTNCSSLVIPYFDMETESFITRWEKQDNEHITNMQKLAQAYQHGGTSDEDLHLACTLDQSYYTSLPDSSIRNRDRDQVVFRFHSRKEEDPATSKNRTVAPYGNIAGEKHPTTQSGSKRLAKLVMVSQLWLWKINEDTLTAFPERWCESQEDDILTHVLRNISEYPPCSLDEMIQDILRQCIGFVDAPSNAGLDGNLFDIFEQSIAKLSNNETACYKLFCKHQTICAQMNPRMKNGENVTQAELAYFRDAEDNICDITEEVKHLEEIKDICDELKMIQRVLEDQEIVLKKYSKAKNSKLDKDVLDSLSFRQLKAARLYNEAESVGNSLRNLLDLKQKQGNLNEARDMRKLADAAEKRDLDGKTQSQLLFVFTFVTVIYLRFALNNTDSPFLSVVDSHKI
ncbi:hypothetical protein F5B20DRAFT_591008 [Whalleya microplaca]|nr:hypothetical protein F5B20DRAFT_591008 [Whalleya microplaca]